VQRVASNSGVIMAAGQKVALGRIHTRAIVTVHVSDTMLTIDLPDDTLLRVYAKCVDGQQEIANRRIDDALAA
jgi:hypothetical protein